jgi:hypothetical protein
MISLLLALTLAADGGVLSAPKNGIDASKLPFTPDSIRRVMTAAMPQIQGCYEETLAGKDKAIEGSLATTFTITGEGFVKDAKVNKKKSSLKEDKLHGCVVSLLLTLEFPRPPDGKDQPIEYPFNLKAVH